MAQKAALQRALIDLIPAIAMADAGLDMTLI